MESKDALAAAAFDDTAKEADDVVTKDIRSSATDKIDVTDNFGIDMT